MRKREEVLSDLISFEGDLSTLQEELAQYSWDTEEAVVTVKREDLSNALRMHLANDINDAELENWANLIEIRDDLDFEDEELQELIFEIANQEINGALTEKRLLEMLGRLS